MKEYDYCRSQFLMPPTNACSKMNYCNADQRYRIQAQIRYEQQLHEQVDLVSFTVVDVKELEE